MGRPEADEVRGMAMNQLGNGLYAADHNEAALSVQEAELSMLQRLGADEDDLLRVQNNLGNSYQMLERHEEGLPLRRDVYSERLRLSGEEHEETLMAANNYAATLNDLERFEEAKVLLRKTMPVARRVLGEGCEATLIMRLNYAKAFYTDPNATLDDLREAVTTLEELETTARRVLGGSYPTTVSIERSLRDARAALRARETPEDGEVLQTADDLAAHFDSL